MRKLKVKVSIEDKIGSFLSDLLKEESLFFSKLMSVKDNVYITEQVKKILKDVPYIISLKDQNRKKILSDKLKKLILNFHTVVKRFYIKNNKAILNFILLLNTYDLIRIYAGVIEDKFRSNTNNEKFLKSISQLYDYIEVKPKFDPEDIILPENILEDYKKILSLLVNLLNKNIGYLNDFINELQLVRDIGIQVNEKMKHILESNKEYKLGQVKEDYEYYLEIKSRLNSLDFNFDEYKVSWFEETQIKNDIKSMKSSVTKIQNLLKSYEKLLLEGE